MMDFDAVDNAMTRSSDELAPTEEAAGGELVPAAECLKMTAKVLTVAGGRSKIYSLVHLALRIANVINGVFITLNLNGGAPDSTKHSLAAWGVGLIPGGPALHTSLLLATAALDELLTLPVTPKGAAALKKRAEAQATQGLAWIVLIWPAMFAVWYLKISDVPWWSYVLAAACGAPVMAFQEACVAVVLAHTIIVADQVEQVADRLAKISRDAHDPKVLEAGRAVFDYDTVSRELHDLYNGLIPRCESSTTGIITVYGALMLAGGAVFTYAGATGAFPTAVLNILMQVFALSF